jgi:hypothetical protein
MSFCIYGTVTMGAVSELSQWGEDDVEGGSGMLFGGIRDSRQLRLVTDQNIKRQHPGQSAGCPPLPGARVGHQAAEP